MPLQLLYNNSQKCFKIFLKKKMYNNSFLDNIFNIYFVYVQMRLEREARL